MKELDVSVLLCAYNASNFIREAIDSVLYQSYTDFELIIVDDGSTDNTPNIIQEYEDPRIRMIPSNHNYISSLNKGLEACKGKYIVRMDSDDIMNPNRIYIQKKIMDIHPEITVCTSWAKTIGIKDKIIGDSAHGLITDIDIRFLLGNFLIHPTSIIRHSFLKKYNLKYENYPYAEDFKLWSEISFRGGTFYVLPQPLLFYRTSPLQVSNKHWEEQEGSRIMIQQEIIERIIKNLNPEFKRPVNRLYNTLLATYRDGLLPPNSIISIMLHIFNKIQIKSH